MAYKYIELFAGCGGLSLGLESSGFELELANELSSMASETFAYNLLGLDKSHVLDTQGGVSCKVAEIVNLNPEDWLKKKLVIGDVINFVETLSNNPKFTQRFKNIDLVSGGPPCQGFSMAGKRKERVSKNALPYAFVDFVNLVRPKVVLLENVEGITRPFKSDGGIKRPWLEIAKSFASIGYAPICFLLNTKYFGVPQSRPRFILIGIKNEYEENILAEISTSGKEFYYGLYESAFKLAKKPYGYIEKFDGIDQKEGIEIELVEIEKINNDIIKNNDHKDLGVVFDHKNLFPNAKKRMYSVTEAIRDLNLNGNYGRASEPYIFQSTKGTELSHIYSKDLGGSIKHPPNHKPGVYNHELRKHSELVKFRFSLIQEVSDMGQNQKTALTDFIKGKNVHPEILDGIWAKLQNKNGFVEKHKINSYDSFIASLESIKSNKHSQRALNPENPAPAQVTIPDDLCHYDKSQPRVLTVREIARIQSFPDEFVFRSKVTTGGKNRSQEVPQYTQVGNAVPPIMGQELGLLIAKILELTKSSNL